MFTNLTFLQQFPDISRSWRTGHNLNRFRLNDITLPSYQTPTIPGTFAINTTLA